MNCVGVVPISWPNAVQFLGAEPAAAVAPMPFGGIEHDQDPVETGRRRTFAPPCIEGLGGSAKTLAKLALCIRIAWSTSADHRPAMTWVSLLHRLMPHRAASSAPR